MRRGSALRVLVSVGLAAGLGLLAVLGLGCWAFSAPRWQGPKSDHFDGERFSLPGAPPLSGFSGFLRWQMNREHTAWPEVRGAQPGPRPPARVAAGELRATWVGHATVLLQLDGLNVLTDPIWSQRCSPFDFAGPKRVRPPGVRFEDLPPIDAVLVSHNHYDHMDVPTLQRLQRAFPHARIFTGLGNGAYLRSRNVLRAEELDWWQSAPLGHGVTVTAVPAQHFSNRGLCDQNGTLFGGFVLRGPSGQTFFAGDTGYGPHFAAIRQRLGPMRLAVLPIGAYKPVWFMGPIHLSPAQAVRAHEDLAAGTSLAMHYATFDLADEGPDEAQADLRQALRERGVSEERFWLLGFGEGRDVPQRR